MLDYLYEMANIQFCKQIIEFRARHQPNHTFRLVATFCIFCLLLMFKCYFFQKICFGYMGGISFLSIYPKALIACIIAVFLLITKNHWWTVVFALLVDCWTTSNVIYHKVNGYFLNIEALQMVDNMEGFWSSITIFFSWREVIPFISTILYAIILYFIGAKVANRKIKFFSFLFPLLLIAQLSLNLVFNQSQRDYILIKYSALSSYFIQLCVTPYYETYYTSNLYFTHGMNVDWEKSFIYQHSILDYPMAIVSRLFYDYHLQKDLETSLIEPYISPEDKVVLDSRIGDKTDVTPNSNLIILLVESLESWVLEDFEGSQHIAPNMRRLIARDNVIYASSVISQARQGTSGDGQLTTLTGLLPLEKGAACRLYGDNNYPSLLRLYNESETINPSPGVWNQRVVNPNYGIKKLTEFEAGNDIAVVDTLISRICNRKDRFATMAITISSHSPFSVSDKPNISLSKEIPETFRNYLTCIHFADSAIGKVVDEIETNPSLQNTTLVIVGDHIIFSETMLREFQSYAEKAEISVSSLSNYIPLIVSSPSISGRIIVSQESYQMDIYPTVLNILGCKDYWWQGFGKDLSDMETTREFSPDIASRISNFIIRSNYLASE